MTVAVGNLAEVEVAVGTGDPDEAADRLLDLGVDLAVVKMGPTASWPRRARRVEVPPFPVEVVNGLGAGDAFGGRALPRRCWRVAAATTMRFANAAGAIVASRLACSDAMPTDAEVDESYSEGEAVT